MSRHAHPVADVANSLGAGPAHGDATLGLDGTLLAGTSLRKGGPCPVHEAASGRCQPAGGLRSFTHPRCFREGSFHRRQEQKCAAVALVLSSIRCVP